MSELMKRSARCLLAVMLMLALLPSSHTAARADISEYNSALQAGDYATALEEAKDLWPVLLEKKSLTARVASEFGMTALLAGDFAAADHFATQAWQVLETLDEEQTETLKLIADFARFRAGQSKARHEVLDTLERLVSLDENPNKFALTIGTDLAHLLVQQEKPGDAERAFEAVSDIWNSAGDDFLDQWMNSRLQAHIYGYEQSPHKRDYYALIESYQTYLERWKAMEPDKERDGRFRTIAFKVAAWRMTLESALRATEGFRSRRVPEMPRRSLWRNENLSDENNQSIKYCKGSLRFKPSPRYPASARTKLSNGTVIIKFDIREDGVIENVETLAAAPDTAEFVDPVLKVADRWKWISQADGECRTARKNAVASFKFFVSG